MHGDLVTTATLLGTDTTIAWFFSNCCKWRHQHAAPVLRERVRAAMVGEAQPPPPPPPAIEMEEGGVGGLRSGFDVIDHLDDGRIMVEKGIHREGAGVFITWENVWVTAADGRGQATSERDPLTLPQLRPKDVQPYPTARFYPTVHSQIVKPNKYNRLCCSRAADPFSPATRLPRDRLVRRFLRCLRRRRGSPAQRARPRQAITEALGSFRLADATHHCSDLVAWRISCFSTTPALAASAPLRSTVHSVIAGRCATCVLWPVALAVFLTAPEIPLHHRDDLLCGCRRWSWSSMASQAARP